MAIAISCAPLLRLPDDVVSALACDRGRTDVGDACSTPSPSSSSTSTGLSCIGRPSGPRGTSGELAVSLLPLLALLVTVTSVPSGVLSISRKSGSQCITLGGRVAGDVGVLPVERRRGRTPGANLKAGMVMLPTGCGKCAAALPLLIGVRGEIGEDTIGVGGSCFDTGRSAGCAPVGMFGDSGESSANVPRVRCEMGGLEASSGIASMFATPKLELRVRVLAGRKRGPPGRRTGRRAETGRAVTGGEGKSDALGEPNSGSGMSPTEDRDDCMVY